MLHPSLTLKDNFISRPHYLTEELLVHAGINHLLCMYMCFPASKLTDYSLRNTGNRGIEAIHGMFRGGTTSLPITSPNLSFREFLEKMNKAEQIHRAEHALKKIDGCPIVASKKKRRTFALRSNENDSETAMAYTFPETFVLFIKSLEDACGKGDSDSKELIEKLAPQMAKMLKEEKKWEQPDVPLEDVPKTLKRVLSLSEVQSLDHIKIDALMAKELGECVSSSATTAESSAAATTCVCSEEDSTSEALANLLVDIDISAAADGGIDIHNSNSLRKTLSGLQPQREVPNKNRGKRFAAGQLLLDACSSGNTVEYLQFWAVKPTKKALLHAKVFLLGQISLILYDGMPSRSAELNPSTKVVLTMHQYHSDTCLYCENGRSSFLEATAVLHCNITSLVQVQDKSLTFSHTECKELEGYIPFSEDINITERLETFGASTGVAIEEDEEDNEEDEEIEEIVKKQFNSRQNRYEFLVKWKGYSSKHNTWELITNIPDKLLQEFEVRNLAPSSTGQTGQYQLRDRQTIRPRMNPDYITS